MCGCTSTYQLLLDPPAKNANQTFVSCAFLLQAETYRRMKKATKNKWGAHVPATNVFWMQYLVDICMTEVSEAWLLGSRWP